MDWLFVFGSGLIFAATQAVAWGGLTLWIGRNLHKSAYAAGIAALATLVLVWGLSIISEALALLQFVIFA